MDNAAFLQIKKEYWKKLKEKLSEEIKEKHTRVRRGFGSVRVKVTIGKTSWKTSIFPDKRSGTYLLPLKAAARRAEGLAEGDTIAFTLTI